MSLGNYAEIRQNYEGKVWGHLVSESWNSKDPNTNIQTPKKLQASKALVLRDHFNEPT